ncbi:lysophospholipid acyltransferase family protein [Marinobacter lacisalsi]|uniref:Lysophospholipid acyltransferase family protein n=1 Tax=Marinobacter lacisalsi TaxID=475979 RepID=A0ABV8QGR5_9GAMM
MAALRLAFRLPLLMLVLSVTALVALLFLLAEGVTRRRYDRTRLAQLCFVCCYRCLGLRIRQTGPTPRSPALLVSNHISWSDIPVLGGLTQTRFLSKAEVARWPLVGWLARQAGTLFIRRGGGEAAQRRNDIRETLEAGQSVLIFPEGTTSAGLTVLPFFPRLIGAATAAGAPIVPVSIAYVREDDPCHVAPFIGDDEFTHHLIRMLAAPAPEVRVTWHQPVAPLPGESARDLSNRVREVIVEGLRRSHQEAGVRGAPAATSSSVASRAEMISRSK